MIGLVRAIDGHGAATPDKLAFSGFGGDRPHISEIPRETGWPMQQELILRLDEHPTGKIFRTAFLRDNDLRSGGEPWEEKTLIRTAALAAAADEVAPNGAPRRARLRLRPGSR